MKLNQVIAIEQSVKSKGNARKSEHYKLVQKPTLFEGFSKTYQSKFEGGEKFPDEKKKVQFTAKQLVFRDVAQTLSGLFDVEATKDYANCSARADIVVDGQALVKDAPVTFLLYLAKELTDLDTFVAALPVLPEDQDWKLDEGSGLHRTEPTETIRTKKVQKPIVLYPATPEHPAQTQLIVEDEVVGTWSEVKTSGAISSADKQRLLDRVRKLSDAVKVAREKANMIEAEEQNAGAVLTGWLLGGF